MSANSETLAQPLRARLHEVARQAIDVGVRTGVIDPIALDGEPAPLRAARGCFITLHKEGKLRGCLGSLHALGPLVQEVARLAYAAATRDPRFPAVNVDELALLTIKISVLSEPVPMSVSSEAELLSQLRPGVDGVILSEGERLGTFLPEVWDSFPSAPAFVDQLRAKAGLPPGYWSDTIELKRYTTQSF